MKRFILALLFLAPAFGCFAQKYITRTGKISFYSTTPIENIEAFNNEVGAVLDGQTSNLVFKVAVTSFKFSKQEMQNHFNEDFMESEKYPKSEFAGKITNMAEVNLSKDGTYKVTASGKLTMHGVTNEVIVPGTATVKDGVVTLNAKFKIKMVDYKIKTPSILSTKVASEIEVTVNCILKPGK